ncbi:MAG: hypothetical protein HY810_05145 [Candidatus Omnitrophica bacterium]|nr:hypothetical protein [Candidatus Omnitrophota bacterium]
MDIKAPLDKEKYSCLAGAEVNLAAIKNSIEIIMKSVIDYEFRTTVVPGLLEIDDILRIAKDVYGAKRYVLQQFDPKEALDCSLHAVKPYDTQILIQAALSAKEFVRDCFVRGI